MLDINRLDADFDKSSDKEQWRDFLVFWGRKRRAMDPNYWIRGLIYGINFKKMKLGDDLTITDVRYLNEAEWINKHRGRLIYIERPGVTAANDEEAQSITKILNVSLSLSVQTIANDGTIEQLHARVRSVLE